MNLLHVLRGPRSLTLSSGLAARLAGFVTSFLIARLLGPLVLGQYLTILTTASSAIQPFAQVLNNNATLLATDASREAESKLRPTLWANLLLAIVLAGVSFIVFLVMLHLATGGSTLNSPSSPLDVLAGAAVVFGQLASAVLLGVHFGTRRFSTAALISVAVSALSVVCILPAIVFFGLSGAFVALVAVSAALPIALAISGHRLTRKEPDFNHRLALLPALNQFRASLPSVARAGVGAASFWFCAIYLVQQSFGLKGIGLVAVSMQWMTFILFAATSWRGVSTKQLADAVAAGHDAIRATVRALLKHDVAATSAAAVVVFASASWIETAYGLEGSGLILLLRMSALCGVVAAFNGVFERLLLCLNRQGLWFLFSAVGFTVQVTVTVAFLDAGLFVVPLGLLAGAVVLMALCAVGFRGIVSGSAGKS